MRARMASPPPAPTGMRAFLVVWAGQFVSILGTAMTSFALIFWVWEVTGSATALALMGVAAFGPTVIFSPIAGALVDRWNRKLTMVMADLGAGIGTSLILVLFLIGRLEVWYLYPIVAVQGAFSAFHFLAYSAAITMLVEKKHYARASGMLSLAESLSGVLAPFVAAFLLVLAGLPVIFAIDLMTVAVAVVAVAVVRVPQPPVSDEARKEKKSLWRESVYGFRYIYARRSLLGLQLVFFALNLIMSFAFILLPAMVLGRTGNDALRLGTVLGAGAIGSVVGGVTLSVWGGPKRKIQGVLFGMAAAALATVLLGVARDVPLWVGALFVSSFFIVILNGSNQAIWQAKVAPDLQGRVFAARRLIAQVSAPVAMLFAGPLADFIFEPGMRVGGSLSSLFGGLVGTGTGAGIALMFVFAGILGTAVPLAAYGFRSIRDVETVLPDHAVAAGA